MIGWFLFYWTNEYRDAKWGLEKDGSLKASTASRVLAESERDKLVEPKARLEQIFRETGVDVKNIDTSRERQNRAL